MTFSGKFHGYELIKSSIQSGRLIPTRIVDSTYDRKDPRIQDPRIQDPRIPNKSQKQDPCFKVPQSGIKLIHKHLGL